jgi:hypothetical protein
MLPLAKWLIKISAPSLNLRLFVSDQARYLDVLAAEGTGQASVLDDPTPPLLAAVSMSNRFAAGQGPSSSRLASAQCHACRCNSPLAG